MILSIRSSWQKNKELKANKISKIKYGKIIVIISIAAIVFYTIAAFILLNKGLIIDSTLTTCFYSFFGGELLILGGIKISDTKYQQNIDDNIQNDENGVG